MSFFETVGNSQLLSRCYRAAIVLLSYCYRTAIAKTLESRYAYLLERGRSKVDSAKGRHLRRDVKSRAHDALVATFLKVSTLRCH